MKRIHLNTPAALAKLLTPEQVRKLNRAGALKITVDLENTGKAETRASKKLGKRKSLRSGKAGKAETHGPGKHW